MIFLTLCITYWIFIYLLIKYDLFKIIDYHIVYIHERGHQKIYSLFGVKTQIQNIIIAKTEVSGECEVIGDNKVSVFELYFMTFLHFVWELLFIAINLNRSWLDIFSQLKNNKEMIIEHRQK